MAGYNIRIDLKSTQDVEDPLSLQGSAQLSKVVLTGQLTVLFCNCTTR